MKAKNEDTRSCALCIHASLLPSAEAKKPPLLFALTADGMAEEVRILCPYKKNAAADFSCRRFCFDPLKYKPKKAPPLQGLDEDALLD